MGLLCHLYLCGVIKKQKSDCTRYSKTYPRLKVPDSNKTDSIQIRAISNLSFSFWSFMGINFFFYCSSGMAESLVLGLVCNGVFLGCFWGNPDGFCSCIPCLPWSSPSDSVKQKPSTSGLYFFIAARSVTQSIPLFSKYPFEWGCMPQLGPGMSSQPPWHLIG